MALTCAVEESNIFGGPTIQRAGSLGSLSSKGRYRRPSGASSMTALASKVNATSVECGRTVTYTHGDGPSKFCDGRGNIGSSSPRNDTFPLLPDTWTSTEASGQSRRSVSALLPVLDVPDGGAATGVRLAYCRRSIAVQPRHAAHAMYARSGHALWRARVTRWKSEGYSRACPGIRYEPTFGMSAESRECAASKNTFGWIRLTSSHSRLHEGSRLHSGPLSRVPEEFILPPPTRPGLGAHPTRTRSSWTRAWRMFRSGRRRAR